MRKIGVITAVIIVVIVCVVKVALVVQQGFGTRTEPSGVEAYLATRMRDWSVPKSSKVMRNPVPCSQEALAEARVHFADHCAICHANNGSGDSMFGRTMYPRPPDMRKQDTRRRSDGQLYYTIQNGVRLSGMPAFGEAGNHDTDTWKLVCFVRHLPSMTSEEERVMEALNPKTPDEFEEERQERNFLNGGGPPENHTHHK